MRKALGSMIVISLIAVVLVSTAMAPAPNMVPMAVASAGAVDSAHGARACFGVGTNNCCGEFMVVGVLAAATFNIWALALATAAAYEYCY